MEDSEGKGVARPGKELGVQMSLWMVISECKKSLQMCVALL